MGVGLFDYQLDAISRMHNGCILNGDVGSGKSRTGLGYYFQLNGGSVGDRYSPMVNPTDLYIITTAQKRDKNEWEYDMAPFLLSTDPNKNKHQNKVIVDSWNNIQKYKGIQNAFFIFDEQRVVGKGQWVKSFLKITKFNQWILLTATPGDKWEDYIPVFVANGFYRNRTEFNTEHIVWSQYTKYPKIERYLGTGRLIRLRDRILVNMDDQRHTTPHHDYIICEYDINKYKTVTRYHWNIFEDKPIENASELGYLMRKVVNSDEDRLVKLLEIFEKHPRMIVFYNYDYELEALKSAYYGENTEVAEWNGHKHQPLPEGEKWVYLVQYTAGCEGWNCTKTDTIVFFSQSYSYRMTKQACGRIDRLNTPYRDLYYYHFKSHSPIDSAINKSLSQKKNFNEAAYAKKMFEAKVRNNEQIKLDI